MSRRPTARATTRVRNGEVQANYGTVGGGQTLKETGAILACDLFPQKGPGAIAARAADRFQCGWHPDTD